MQQSQALNDPEHEMENRLQKFYEDKKYFEVLEIDPTMDLDLINKAFRKVAIKYHPDKGGTHDEMCLLVEIMGKLRNEDFRQKYFQHITTTENTFDEANFEFENTFRNYTPEDIRNNADKIIQSFIDECMEIASSRIQDFFAPNYINDCLSNIIQNPFEVDFLYKCTRNDVKIEIDIKEELSSGEYCKQHFQHIITNVAFINSKERSIMFLASSENLQEKVNTIIQRIKLNTTDSSAIKPHEELFNKLNRWIKLQLEEHKKIPQTEIAQNFGKNTRRGQMQKILDDRIKMDGEKQNPVSKGMFAKAITGFFSLGSALRPERNINYFEIDYRLLAIGSLTIAVTARLCLLYWHQNANRPDAIDRPLPFR